MLLYQELCAECAASFLVTERGEDDIAGQGFAGGMGAQEGGEHHGDTTFHIERATPPNIVIHLLRFKGGMLPLLLFGGYDINMALEQQWRGVSCPFETCDKAGSIGV